MSSDTADDNLPADEVDVVELRHKFRAHPQLCTEAPVTLRIRLNDLLPFFQLPVEIFVLIFKSCITLTQTLNGDMFGGMFNYADEPEHLWVKSLTHVCHRWRDMALNMAHIWRHIVVGDGFLPRIRAFVRRANGIPLEIEALYADDDDDGNRIRKSLRFLSPYVSEARSLTLNLLDEQIDTLLSRAPSTALAVESLYFSHLASRNAGSDEPRDRLIFFDKCTTPFLKSLHIQGYVVDWKKLSLPQTIVHLRISEEGSESLSSVSDIVHVLGGLPSLRYAHLSEEIPPTESEPLMPLAPPSETAIPSLPYLKVLHFKSSLRRCAQLVNYCTIQVPTKLKLSFDSWSSSPEALSALISGLSRKLHSLAPKTLGVDESSLMVRADDVILEEVKPTDDEDSPMVPQIELRADSRWNRHNGDVEDVFGLLPLDSFSSLILSDITFRNDLAANAWGTLVASMPKLAILCFSSRGSGLPAVHPDRYAAYHSLLVLLGCEASTGSPASFTLVHTSRMPKLRYLCINDIVMPLAKRNHGIIAAEELAQAFKNLDHPPEKVFLHGCINMTATDVDRLREAVSIQWDGYLEEEYYYDASGDEYGDSDESDEDDDDEDQSDSDLEFTDELEDGN